MASQQEDMFYESVNRSPGQNPRGYNAVGLNRQPSRQFEGYPQQSMYSTDDYGAMRYDTSRSDRAPPQLFVGTNYPGGYDSQTWNYAASNANAATMGPSSRARPSARRTALPNQWMDSQHQSQYQTLPTGQGLNGMANGHGTGHYSQPPTRPDKAGGDLEEELIPTAIVIKNIPFAIKREQLTEVMSDLNLPLPYAFNYHFDNGVFRGLAFANFSSSEETSQVIQVMNHMELQGRKLRVEYKKMLPLQERERIEREKRERRGQLEEQHRPMQSLGLQNQTSMSSLSPVAPPAQSPSPVSTRAEEGNGGFKLDMNDPRTLDYYAKLVIFKGDQQRKVVVFGPPLGHYYRRVCHELAHNLGLQHNSVGPGDQRHVQIYKDKQDAPPPDVHGTNWSISQDLSRRGLARAATIDFGEARETAFNHSLRNQHSGLLDIPQSPGLGGINGRGSLREAKSFGDLQARTASPALSNASFPAALRENVTRYTDYGMLNGGTASTNLTPTSAGLPIGGADAYLNGFANLNLYDRPSGSRLNGRLGMSSESHSTTAGAIGSQRGGNGISALNGSYEDLPRNGTTAAPERQPRGPGSEWGAGFSRPRQNGSGPFNTTELLDETEQTANPIGQPAPRYL